MALFLALITTVAMLAGCGGAKAPEANAAAPAPVAAEPCPEPEPVDENAIITKAAADYFTNLPASKNMIDASAVKEKMDAKDATLFLLDIRGEADFAAGHPEGAINIPFGAVGANLDKLPKDKQIVVYCFSGQQSGQATAVLKMAGYNAISLKGGYPSFEKAGVASVK